MSGTKMTSGSLAFLRKFKIPKTMGIRRRFGQYWSEFCQKMSNNFRSSDSDFFDVAAAVAAILNGRKSHFSTAVWRCPGPLASARHHLGCCLLLFARFSRHRFYGTASTRTSLFTIVSNPIKQRNYYYSTCIIMHSYLYLYLSAPQKQLQHLIT